MNELLTRIAKELPELVQERERFRPNEIYTYCRENKEERVEVLVFEDFFGAYTLEDLMAAQKNGRMRELFTDPFLGGSHTPADVGIDITQIADGTSEI